MFAPLFIVALALYIQVKKKNDNLLLRTNA